MNEKSINEESQYGLRSRDTLRPPSRPLRYSSQDSCKYKDKELKLSVKTIKLNFSREKLLARKV